MEDSIILTVFLLFIIGYVVLYIWGRKYLERYEDVPRFNKDGSPVTSATQLNAPPALKANTRQMQVAAPIDDFEHSAVFQNQGSREASQKQISDAMSAYPLDWTNHGPNSALFQEEQAEVDRMERTKKWDASLPKAVDMTVSQASLTKDSLPQPMGYYEQGVDDALADTAAQEEEERKILQTYEPKKSKGLLEYSVEDVKSMLERIYGKRGLIPTVVKSKQAPNAWEVIEVQEKNPKIVWEDSPEAMQRMRGEEAITVPYAASDLAANLDPFMQARHSSRKGPSDLSEQLDRMYQTVQPVPAWN